MVTIINMQLTLWNGLSSVRFRERLWFGLKLVVEWLTTMITGLKWELNSSLLCESLNESFNDSSIHPTHELSPS